MRPKRPPIFLETEADLPRVLAPSAAAVFSCCLDLFGAGDDDPPLTISAEAERLMSEADSLKEGRADEISPCEDVRSMVVGASLIRTPPARFLGDLTLVVDTERVTS
jgi:hypothetical protein